MTGGPQSDERFRWLTRAVEQSPAAVLITDVAGRIVFINPRFTEMTGYAESEALGQTPRILKSGLTPVEVYRELWRTITAGREWSGELQNRRKNGELYWHRTTISPMLDSTGVIAHFLAVQEDVTDRRRAQEIAAERGRLAELSSAVASALTREASLSDALQSSADAIVRYADAAFARIWTLDPSGEVLELKASAGLYTRLDGSHARVRVGEKKIGLIAVERRPHLTNSVFRDPRVSEQEWAKREGMVSFAGYPLQVDGELVGVAAMFARQELTETVLEALALVADLIAVGIRRRQVEEGLRRREEHLSSIYNTVADVIFSLEVDREGSFRFSSVNEAFTAKTGLSAAEVMGKRVEEVIPPPSLALVLEKYREAIRERRIVRWEETSTYPSGVRTGEVSVAPVFDQSGRCTSLIGSVQDLTERQRAAEALKNSEALFRQLAENISEVFFLTDAEFRQTFYVSPAYEKVWGRSLQSVYESPSSFLDPLPPEDRDRVVEYNDRVRRGEDAGEVEFRVVRPGGERRWVLARATPVRNEKGDVYRISGVALDITERKAAEEALRASERRLRTLFETVNLIVLVLDRAGRVEYVNPFLLRFTGYGLEDVVGCDWIERFVPSAERDRLRGVFGELLDQELHPHYQNSIVTKSGEERTIAWHNTVLRDTDGRRIGTLSIGEDATERSRLEAQLVQAQKMEAVGRLAGGVAHDFNNLLTVIIGETDLLRLPPLPGESAWAQTEGLEEIRKAADRAAVLTRQLLAFSRRQLTEPTVFELDGLVATMTKMLRRLIGEDLELVSRLSGEEGFVRADRGQMEQVLANLVVNARDAMPQGGTLTLETTIVRLDPDDAPAYPDLTPGDYVVLSVKDTGLGMTEEVKLRAFDPFFTTKEQGKGTGLGLATCYGIVKQAGGRIGLYSERGMGTTVKVYLPLVVPPGKDGKARAPEVAPTGKETILLVEDEAPVRRIAARALGNLGYTVIEAHDGPEALRLLEEHEETRIDLLLTDVVLPKMGGREVADAVRARRPDIKVLYASGYTDDVILQHRLGEGGTSLLEKPFTRESLARKVRDVLDR